MLRTAAILIVPALALAGFLPAESALAAATYDSDSDARWTTEMPEGWRARCAQMKGKPLAGCASLEDAHGPDAEWQAFRLNLAASDSGLHAGGLGELHFAHGRYAGWKVRDLLEAEKDPKQDRSTLRDLAAAVNRAFVGGHDAGVLARWVESPLCSSQLTVEGPASARCGLLDSSCMRGRYVESLGCCTADPAPPGALCPAGVCGPDGACVDELPADAKRVHGGATRFELLGGGNLWEWTLDDGAVRVSRVENQAASTQTATQKGGYAAPDLQDFESWTSRWGGQRGQPIAEFETLPKERRIRIGATSEDVPTVGVDATDGATALFLAGQHDAVCVVQGEAIDDLGPVLSDCSTAGGLMLHCPGKADLHRLDCLHEGDRTVLRGSKLTLAFAVDPSPTDQVLGARPVRPLDIVSHLFRDRVCVGARCARTLDHVGLHIPVDFDLPWRPPPLPSVPSRSCDLGGGCTGRLICLTLADGIPRCTCIGRTERCNGEDDDCDGEIDENGEALCDDGVACTQNRCFEGECIEGSPARNSAHCTEAFCATGICNGEPPPSVDPSAPASAADANGCQFVLDHSFCENVYDRCACNGISFCNPARAAGQGPGATITGCAETDAYFSPCEIRPGGDSDACTQELCCEPDPSCRHLVNPPQMPFGSTTFLSPTDPLCTSPAVARHAASSPVNRDTTVQCVNLDQYASRRDRVRLRCNDSNPCTLDQCTDTFFGACTHTPIGRRPPFPITAPPLSISIAGQSIPIDGGCEGVVGLGCGFLRCSVATASSPMSTCVVAPRPGLETPGSTTELCGNNNPAGECRARSCDGLGDCVGTLDAAFCPDDGLECTVASCTETIPAFDGDGIRSICVQDIVDGWCLIGGRCFRAGDPRPGPDGLPADGCQICDPANSGIWTDSDDEECLI